MNSFHEITGDDNVNASKVDAFFKAVQTTFSPALPTSDEYNNLSQVHYRKRQKLMPKLVRTTSDIDDDPRSIIEIHPQQRQPNLIVVVHLLPTLPAYLRGLQQIGVIKVIIFKGALEGKRPEHMQQMAGWVSAHENYKNVVHPKMTKELLRKPGEAIKLISDAVDTGEAEVIILDIGGYFAPCLTELANQDRYSQKWKLLGIVEDTENGHQKYHNAIQSLTKNLKPPRIYSVARSLMKMTEDYNVGKSIVRAADIILRQALDKRLEDHPVVGVIGFGKIGSSIAMHVRQQHIGKVMVYDVNSTIMLRAVSQDFVICSKEDMLQEASLIFCATGNKALTFNDILHVGKDINRLIIASCTSADDELDVHESLQRYKNDSFHSSSFSSYTVQRLDGTDVQVILLCDGNAINFSCRAILGEFIRSVQAAMMVCALNLQRTCDEQNTSLDILTLTNEEEVTIARMWLEHFSKIGTRLITNVDRATKYDQNLSQHRNNSLIVDSMLVAQLKQCLGLQRAVETDPIDFIDSERKLIVTAPIGSGKSTVITSLIQDTRNYYDLIWWFDCSDPRSGGMLHLAQILHISYITLSSDELQRTVLKFIFSSMSINNFLLILDNVRDFNGKSVTAESAVDDKTRKFECCDLLFTLDKALRDPSVRRQRRRHIVALYSEDSANQIPVEQLTGPRLNRPGRVWLHMPLESIITNMTKQWACSKLHSFTNESRRKRRYELIHKVLSIDGRRLTTQLAAVLLTSEDVTKKDIKNRIEIAVIEGSDVLASLVELALDKLQALNLHLLHCAQVVSLIQANRVSRAVCIRLLSILPQQQNFETDDTTLMGREIHEVWQQLFLTLKKFRILKNNTFSTRTQTHTSENYIPSDYLDIYYMPTAYTNALRKPLLADTTNTMWNYALELANAGFSYDYDAVQKREHMSKITHYFEHAYVLAKHANSWDGTESYATLFCDLLWRLGSFYLNELRLYAEATTSFHKAYKLLKNIDSRKKVVYDDTMPQSLHVTKLGAKIYWHICDQLTRRPCIEDQSNIAKLEECQRDLMSLEKKVTTEEKQRSHVYQTDAVVAIARIRVQHIQENITNVESKKNVLKSITKDLQSYLNQQEMSIRRRSLVLQILGSACSELGKHEAAIDCMRKSLDARKGILLPDHVDLARAQYKLSYCLIQWVKDIKTKRPENMVDYIKYVHEAKQLCEAALKIQRAQLPVEHDNLKECNILSFRINALLQEK